MFIWIFIIIFVPYQLKTYTMNVTEVSNEIKKLELFKDLVLSEPSDDSQHGTILVHTRHFKDSNKNEIKLHGFYSLFIAHMYKDTEKEFFYLLFSHRGQQRDYRRRSFYDIEYNKIFASGNSVDKLMSDFESKLIGYELK